MPNSLLAPLFSSHFLYKSFKNRFVNGFRKSKYHH